MCWKLYAYGSRPGSGAGPHGSVPPDPYGQPAPGDAGGCGKGCYKGTGLQGHRRLITDVPGLTLVTFYADCVPLYFVDRTHRAIGLSHSGWRGTVKAMGQETIKAMKEAFGTRPEDLVVCIGPSICEDCYEVGEEVIAEFAAAFREEHHPALFTTKKRMENTSWISGRPTGSFSGKRACRRQGSL